LHHARQWNCGARGDERTDDRAAWRHRPGITVRSRRAHSAGEWTCGGCRRKWRGADPRPPRYRDTELLKAMRAPGSGRRGTWQRQRFAIAADDVRVPERARLWRARHGLVVHMHDAESLGKAKGPFVVVEQRPDEIAAQIHALAHGFARGQQVLAQIPDAERIIDSSVDGLWWIVERRAILGHVHRNVAIAFLHPAQHAR